MLRDLLLLGFSLQRVAHVAPCWDNGCIHEQRAGVVPLGEPEPPPEPHAGLPSPAGRAGAPPRARVLGARAAARASKRAADMYASKALLAAEFSSNLLGFREAAATPGWVLPLAELERRVPCPASPG